VQDRGAFLTCSPVIFQPFAAVSLVEIYEARRNFSRLDGRRATRKWCIFTGRFVKSGELAQKKVVYFGGFAN